MKRWWLLGSVFMLSAQTFAASVNITSFYYIRNDNRLAELCGKVDEQSQVPTYVKIVSDYQTNRPAVYNTLADENGKFCLTLVTLSGKANATVFGETQVSKAVIK